MTRFNDLMHRLFHRSWMWNGGLEKVCRHCGRTQLVKWFSGD